MIDNRSFNFRKNPSIQHRVRKIVQGNITGDVYGITLPKAIAEPFLECWMRIYTSGTSLILESGCKLTPEDIDRNKKFCFAGMREIRNKSGQVEWVK